MNRRRRTAPAAGLAIGLLMSLPALVAAHPLGNFTINHYAGLRVEPDRVLLDIVIDEAEIPAFQERQTFDTDADGSVSADEIDTARGLACQRTASGLRLTADGTALDLELTEAGLSFPSGVGGLSTMRLVCAFSARLPTALTAEPTRISFDDGSFADRLGWREIVAEGSGATLSAVNGSIRSAGLSQRLTRYPEERIASPLDDRSVTIDAVVGGDRLAPFDITDAAPLPPAAEPGGPAASATPVPSGSPAASPSASAPVVGAVPGGIGGGELPEIFRQADLTPIVLLLALVTAAGLGAGHALTPGHGKTLMAAYLVGTRGTPRHALGLGLSVSLSHTVGILILAAIVVGASDVLPPDAVVRGAPVVAALSIAAIGGWMLFAEVRRRRAAVATIGHDHAQDHDHAHDHAHGASHDTGLHSHGGVAHSHLPAAGSTITWRSLFALGLAGGLIPSTSALLILLGSIAAGRPTFGFVLVLAFGLGMAAVMAGIGLTLVVARQRLDRLPMGGGLARLREVVPLVAAVVVFGFGIYLTAQAIGGAPTL
ncbi:MAG: nickel/cobalt transporter [Candidatus Limnocylindrales bacterium]